MKFNILPFVLVVLMCAVGCRKKQPVDTTPAPSMEPPVLVDDTLNTFENEQDSIPEIEEEIVEVVTEEGVDLSDHYFLIAASFVLPENARRKVNEFREYGYKAKVIMRDNDQKYRVALRSYSSKQEALNACENLKDNDPDLDKMWVLVSFRTEDREFDEN